MLTIQDIERTEALRKQALELFDNEASVGILKALSENDKTVMIFVVEKMPSLIASMASMILGDVYYNRSLNEGKQS